MTPKTTDEKLDMIIKNTKLISKNIDSINENILKLEDKFEELKDTVTINTKKINTVLRNQGGILDRIIGLEENLYVKESKLSKLLNLKV